MNGPFAGIDACVFDAYGTLLDLASATGRFRDRLGDRADAFAAAWRLKQIEYTWLRTLMGRYADFENVTADALHDALDEVGIADDELAGRLLRQYRRLSTYPDVTATLAALRGANLSTAILSNGTADMLHAGVAAAGIGDQLDAVLSVDEIGLYKPHPDVYRFACDRLGLTKNRICFVSSNAWDAAGAAAFGFPVVWLNRRRNRWERLPARPQAEIEDLSALPALLGLGPRLDQEQAP